MKRYVPPMMEWCTVWGTSGTNAMTWVTWWNAHAKAMAVASGAVLLTLSSEVGELTQSGLEIKLLNTFLLKAIHKAYSVRLEHKGCVSASALPVHFQISALLMAWPTTWTRSSLSATQRDTWWTAPAMGMDVDAGSATLSVRLWLISCWGKLTLGTAVAENYSPHFSVPSYQLFDFPMCCF